MTQTSTFLAIHSTYDTITAGIFTNADPVDSLSVNHKSACASLITMIDVLLQKNQLELRALDFIAVNQGPGPYTTLRITLANANGLGFATGIPLVGVDGFTAFFSELPTDEYPYMVILFNAFCGEVFYALHERQSDTIEKGYLPITTLVEKLSALGGQPIAAAGNGLILFSNDLAGLPLKSILPNQQAPSLQAVGKTAYANWLKKEHIAPQLLPLYLKKPVYRMSGAVPFQP